MRLSLHPYRLNFKSPFKITHGLRTGTDIVYVKLEHKGYTAWGEAALPPYLPETQNSVIEFLTGFTKTVNGDSVAEWMQQLALDNSPNSAAKAALNMALWGLKAQISNCSIGQLLGIDSQTFPLCTYTIGISTIDEMRVKIEEADISGFELFKIKLTGEGDKEVISNFKKITTKPFAVDVNQGWKSGREAIEKIKWLAEEGCVLVEQPLSIADIDAMPAIKNASPIPIYADESCWNLKDVERMRDGFHGINIKLMKCGGITEAFKMIGQARELGLKVLIGCMSESSVGCTVAANLTPLADYADLDGPYLIANDPFVGMKVEKGRIKLAPLTGSI